MARFVTRDIKPYKPGEKQVSAQDLNDIVARIERLERLTVTPPLSLSQNKNSLRLSILHGIPNIELVELAERLYTDRGNLYSAYPIRYKTPGVTPGTSHSIRVCDDSSDYPTRWPERYVHEYKVLKDEEDKIWYRNPFYFTGDVGADEDAPSDWGLLVRIPSLFADWTIVQVMCPGDDECKDPDPNTSGCPSGPSPPSSDCE